VHPKGVGRFPYFVGIQSLAEIARREDRVCVLNILGSESRTVTPISHMFSGGNIVFGTSPGRTGQVLKTKIGEIPVYNTVREGLEAGHHFSTGVVYLPPPAVKDGVSELIRYNKDLKKIIILAEKISVKDSRTIRAVCQVNGIDVFGGNCLGVADSWNQVRIGGALGGNTPHESLVKGSVAIYSNSGNFTTTIAEYLQLEGWGTTTLISGGKDVYIHYAPREFFFALNADERSKAAVIYVEPGGYYEADLQIDKPTVACVVGRWKDRLIKACGHAGSLAGSGDNAFAKEKWFMDYFGVSGLFTPDTPKVSARGAVVTNIAHIPAALTKVMALNGVQPDFKPRGNLYLKAWFGNNQGITLPDQFDVPLKQAVAPYDEQIRLAERQVGAHFPRTNMLAASGASQVDQRSQLIKLHGVSLFDAANVGLEDNIILALTKAYPEEKLRQAAQVALISASYMENDPMLEVSDLCRESGADPNMIMATTLGLLTLERMYRPRRIADRLIDIFSSTTMKTGTEPVPTEGLLEQLDDSAKAMFRASAGDETAKQMLEALEYRGVRLPMVDFVLKASDGKPHRDAIAAAIWTSIGWVSLKRRRITRQTLQNLPWYGAIFSTIVGSVVSKMRHQNGMLMGVPFEILLKEWDFTEVGFLVLRGHRPHPEQLFEFKLLIGLALTNGPGSLSAHGCKGSVSADGPERNEEVHINKAFMGFLSHTGRGHGGDALDSVQFLIDRFKDVQLKDPGDADHGLDLNHRALAFSRWYRNYMRKQIELGNTQFFRVPSLVYPSSRRMQRDPRERHVYEMLEARGAYNVFLEFYHHLSHAMLETGATRKPLCVSVMAVIASTLLKMWWVPYKDGSLSSMAVEKAAYTIFLLGRMIGCAAEIDDHACRGISMDMATPIDKCKFLG
jgi:succinyl-CoA synthetase alpha subunit